MVTLVVQQDPVQRLSVAVAVVVLGVLGAMVAGQTVAMVVLAVHQRSMAAANIMVAAAAEVVKALGAPAPEAAALGATVAVRREALVAPVRQTGAVAAGVVHKGARAVKVAQADPALLSFGIRFDCGVG